MISDLIQSIDANEPVLIAGPTASGKSALALAIAQAQGGTIINADASQVYDCWRVLTARPDAQEEARAPHALYGHVPYDVAYSVGDWLREITPVLRATRPIVIGGTGLYFSALTDGLAQIPHVPAQIRMQADALSLDALLRDVAPDTLERIDTANRARVQRAWEVERATGTPLHIWQTRTAPPLIPPGRAARIVLDAPRDWLNPRIEGRFSQMLDHGGLDEARAMLDRFDPALPSCRAIGVTEAMAVVTGDMSRSDAIDRASLRTRQYAKRQRTWFRARMAHWQSVRGCDMVNVD